MHTIKLCTILFSAVVHAAVITKIHWCVAVCVVNGHAKCDPLLHRRPCILDKYTGHWSESRILAENFDFFVKPRLHSKPPLGSPHPNIAITFGMNKLYWCGYRLVKNFEVTFIRFYWIHKRDRGTAGCRAMAYAALMHSIMQQKQLKTCRTWTASTMKPPRGKWKWFISSVKFVHLLFCSSTDVHTPIQSISAPSSVQTTEYR